MKYTRNVQISMSVQRRGTITVVAKSYRRAFDILVDDLIGYYGNRNGSTAQNS